MKEKDSKLLIFVLRIIFLVPALCILLLSASLAADPLPLIPRDMVLVIDNSGSMKKNDPQFRARDFVRNFIDNQGKNTRFGMVLFDETTRLLEPLASADDGSARYRLLRSLESIDYTGQWTDIPSGIERAIYELKAHGRNDAFKAIIFITDGIVDTGDRIRDAEKEKWLKQSLTAECRKEGIRIIGVAFTENADFSLIQTLAMETRGEYFRAADLSEMPAIFNSIHNLIRKSAAAPEPPTPIAPPALALQIQQTTPTPPKTAIKPAPAKKIHRRPSEKTDDKSFLIGLAAVIIAGLAFFLIVFVAMYLLRHRPVEKEPDVESSPAEDDHPMIVADAMQAMLIDVKNVTSQKTFPLKKKVVNIGRGQTNDVTIPHTNVSGFHATIEHTDGSYFLIDQRSRNKTFLNGEALEPFAPTRLKSGDEITFTDYRFIFLVANQIPSGDTTIWRNF